MILVPLLNPKFATVLAAEVVRTSGSPHQRLPNIYWPDAATHTATSGLFAGLGTMPHEAERSVSYVAGLRATPQQATTSTSLDWHSATHVLSMQLLRTMRTADAGPAAPCCPCGPAGPGGP